MTLSEGNNVPVRPVADAGTESIYSTLPSARNPHWTQVTDQPVSGAN